MASDTDSQARSDSGASLSTRGVRRWTGAFGLLLLVIFWLLLRNIAGTLPYPQHVDEPFLTGPAQRTLQTGTLHPYTFNYPSLPKYLAALGMAAGFIRGAAAQGVSEIHQVHTVGYPFYDVPVVVATARQLYSLFALVALVAVGAAASRATRRPAALFLAPLSLVMTPLFFYHAWAYLNVDIIGAAFVALTIAATLAAADEPSWGRSGVVPGLYAGLATGSKYTLAVVIIPVLLGIALFVPPRRRAAAWLGAIGAMLLAFLLVVPYSLIDVPGFLNGVASEAFHYASGQRGVQGEPGWPQLMFYGRHFLSEFGAGLLFAVVGIGALARRDWRRTSVLLAFPVITVVMLVRQRVHFERNVLSVHLLVALFAAAGMLAAYDWLRQAINARRKASIDRRRITLVCVTAVALWALPWWHLPGELRAHVDSRNAAQIWLREDLPAGWAIAVPEELAFDSRPLEAKGHRVVTVRLQTALDAGAAQMALAAVPRPAVLLVPQWGADDRFPGGEPVGALNAVTGGWQRLASFGTNAVLVNSPYSSPFGDPAFSVAVIH